MLNTRIVAIRFIRIIGVTIASRLSGLNRVCVVCGVFLRDRYPVRADSEYWEAWQVYPGVATN